MRVKEPKQSRKSTIKPWNTRSVHDNISWVYLSKRDKDYDAIDVERTMKAIRDKRIKSLRIPICGTIGTVMGMAIATYACTLPNIKRIYICDDKEYSEIAAECSKKAGIPLITKNPKSLIPYEVLRTLGKNKVVFATFDNLFKYILFWEDDLHKHKIRPNRPLNRIECQRTLNPDDKKYQYKAEWTSDDEVVIR